MVMEEVLLELMMLKAKCNERSNKGKWKAPEQYKDNLSILYGNNIILITACIYNILHDYILQAFQLIFTRRQRRERTYKGISHVPFCITKRHAEQRQSIYSESAQNMPPSVKLWVYP